MGEKRNNVFKKENSIEKNMLFLTDIRMINVIDTITHFIFPVGKIFRGIACILLVIIFIDSAPVLSSPISILLCIVFFICIVLRYYFLFEKEEKVLLLFQKAYVKEINIILFMFFYGYYCFISEAAYFYAICNILYMLYFAYVSLYYKDIVQVFFTFSWGILSFFLIVADMDSFESLNTSFFSYLFAALNIIFIPLLRRIKFKIKKVVFILLFQLMIYVQSFILYHLFPYPLTKEIMLNVSFFATILPLAYSLFSYKTDKSQTIFHRES